MQQHRLRPHLKASSRLSLSPAARRPLSTTMSSTVPHSGQAPTNSNRLAACTSPPAAEVCGPPCLHSSSSSRVGEVRRLCLHAWEFAHSLQCAVLSPAIQRLQRLGAVNGSGHRAATTTNMVWLAAAICCVVCHMLLS